MSCLFDRLSFTEENVILRLQRIVKQAHELCKYANQIETAIKVKRRLINIIEKAYYYSYKKQTEDKTTFVFRITKACETYKAEIKKAEEQIEASNSQIEFLLKRNDDDRFLKENEPIFALLEQCENSENIPKVIEQLVVILKQREIEDESPLLRSPRRFQWTNETDTHEPFVEMKDETKASQSFVKTEDDIKRKEWTKRRNSYMKDKLYYDSFKYSHFIGELIEKNQKEIKSFLSTILKSISCVCKCEDEKIFRHYHYNIIFNIENFGEPYTFSLLASYQKAKQLIVLADFITNELHVSVPAEIIEVIKAYENRPPEPKTFIIAPMLALHIYRNFIRYPYYEENVEMPEDYDPKQDCLNYAKLKEQAQHQSD